MSLIEIIIYSNIRVSVSTSNQRFLSFKSDESFETNEIKSL